MITAWFRQKRGMGSAFTEIFRCGGGGGLFYKLSTKSTQSFVGMDLLREYGKKEKEENRPDGIIARNVLVEVYKFMFSKRLWDMILCRVL